MLFNKRKLGFLGIVVFLAVTIPLTSCGQSQNNGVVAPANNTQSSANLPANQVAANLPAVKDYVAHILGFEEVPRIDTQALGQAILNLSADGNTLVCKLVVVDIQNVTAAHIHLAAKGQNGPIVATLYRPTPPVVKIPGRFDGVLSETTILAADLEGPLAGQPLSALIEAINRGEAYVNVHTEQSPSGEIRGQVYVQDANNVVTALTSIMVGTVTAITGNNVSIQTEDKMLTVIKDNNTAINTGDVGLSGQLAVGVPVQVHFDPVTSVASIIELEKPGDIITLATTTKVAGTVVSFSGIYLVVKNAGGESALVEVLTGTELQFEDGSPANRTDIKPGVIIEATVKVGSRWATRVEIRR